MKISKSLLIMELISLPFSLGASSDGDGSSVSSLTEKMNHLSLRGVEIFEDLRGKMRNCADLGCVNGILLEAHQLSMDQIVELMTVSEFRLATYLHITKAMDEGYDHYLKYLIMAQSVKVNEVGEETVQLIALETDLNPGYIEILLGHVYGKPWCPFETWDRLALQFRVSLSPWVSTALIRDALQYDGRIPAEVEKDLRRQLSHKDLPDKIVRDDAVEVFKLLYGLEELYADFKSICLYSSMKILKYASSQNIPFRVDSEWSPEYHYFVLPKVIATNDREMIHYLLKWSSPRECISYIPGYVSLDTLKLLYSEENKRHFEGTRFKNLDPEGIMFLVERKQHIDCECVVRLIVQRGDPEMKRLVLDDPRYLERFSNVQLWGELIVKELDLFKNMCGCRKFIPPTHALRALFESGRSDIVEWLDKVRPEVITGVEVIYSAKPILDWILQGDHRDHFDITGKLNDALYKGCYEFVKWAYENGFGLPDDWIGKVLDRGDFEMLDWLMSKDIAPSQYGIRYNIAKGEFSVLEWAMKYYPDLDPGEEFINNLGTDQHHPVLYWLQIRGIDWMPFKERYYHTKNSNKEQNL